MNRYRRLLRYPLAQWPALLGVLALTALVSSGTTLQPWPLQILVDHGLGGSALPGWLAGAFRAVAIEPEPFGLIVAAAAAGLALTFVNALADAALTWAWTVAGQRMVYDLSADLLLRLLRRPTRGASSRSVGDALNRLTGDAFCVYKAAGDLLVSPGQHILTLGMVGSVAWRMDPFLTTVSLVVAPWMALSALIFGPRLRRRARQDREAQSRVAGFVHQTLAAIPVVQAFNAQDENRRRYRALADSAVTRSQQGNLVRNAYAFLNGLVAASGAAVVLYFGGSRVLSGDLSLGELLVFTAYLRSMHGSLRGLFGVYGSLKTVSASADRVLEVMESGVELPISVHPSRLPALAGRAGRHVAIEGVTAGYHPGRPVLEGISLEAGEGETVALVGPTGGGKTTLVSLVPRFIDPWRGRVAIDGVDVRDTSLACLRGQVAVLLQEPFLLPRSIAENIAYGRPGAALREIEAAASAAGADAFIRALPEGYETEIGQRGETLSGGQKQRLAIARAFLKDAPILILDEPTAALDAETEDRFLDALARLMAGKTTFIIAHRISTVQQANRIVFLEGGRITETGSHPELMAAGGAYRRYHELQFADAGKAVAS